VAMSSVMKNAMLLNIKAMKKSKANESKNAQVISKNVKNDKDKDKLKDNEKNKNSTAKKGPKKAPENSDRNIQSVFLAGGILEYGPMILSPNKFKNNVRKLEIGNPLPLGGFARWSKIID
jgi:cobalamin biosynthesis Co2+ chelatase CbiK